MFEVCDISSVHVQSASSLLLLWRTVLPLSPSFLWHVSLLIQNKRRRKTLQRHDSRHWSLRWGYKDLADLQQILGLSTLRLPIVNVAWHYHHILLMNIKRYQLMLMHVWHVSTYTFLWQHNSWNHEPCMCKHQRDWSKWFCLQERSNSSQLTSWGTTSTISTSTSVTQSSTTTSTTLWWAQLTSRLHKTNSEPNRFRRFANSYRMNVRILMCRFSIIFSGKGLRLLDCFDRLLSLELPSNVEADKPEGSVILAARLEVQTMIAKQALFIMILASMEYDRTRSNVC